MICPCQAQQPKAKAYKDCCQPFHLGLPAPSVQALMASRYSAYVLGLTEYIIKTWHPSRCPPNMQLQPDNQWLKLNIVSHTQNTVHFKAYFKVDNEFHCLEELSRFEKVDDHWLYLDGKTDSTAVELSRNDTCLCGSGKKYKKCCGI